MKTALVTGGAGFIGSHLVKGLLEQNFQVIVIDDLSSGTKARLPLNDKLVFYQADIRDEGVQDIYSHHSPDIVFHLAARYANQLSIEFPREDLAVNAGGTLIQLQLALQARVQRFVYASSSCVYEPGESPLTEKSRLIPHTPYGISKLAGEHYCHFFKQNYQLPITIVRYFNAYGPGEEDNRYRGVVPHFINQALKGLPLTITGSGNEKRDFTYIKDTVTGTILSAITDAGRNQTFNIGGGQGTSIINMAETICRLTESSSVIQYIPQRPWDQTNVRIADITKAKRLLNYQPKLDLEAGLSITCHWYATTGKTL